MSPAPVFVRIPGSHHPATRLRLVPGFRDPGSVLILGQVTQYGNPYLICIPHSRNNARFTYTLRRKRNPTRPRINVYAAWNPQKKGTYPGLLRLPLNSLAPGKFELNFRYLILQIISVIDGWGISCELALRGMPLDLTDDKSTLVQVIVWCRQATSHYLEPVLTKISNAIWRH